MPRRSIVRCCSILAWAATVIVVATPCLMGADSGGVLPWTQWAAASACILALCLALAECVLQPTGTWRPHQLAGLLLLLASYGLLQRCPLPTAVLSLVAPGSLDAYSGWLSPLATIPEDAKTLEAVQPKVSVDVGLTSSAVWLTLLIAGFAVLASHLLIERRRIEFLLLVLAATGAVHAGLGICQQLTAADATVWGIRSHLGGKPFGAFINRSNATVPLNLALGSSIGLIGWRLAALTGTPLNGQKFPLYELFDIVMDRVAVFAFVTASGSLIGLLICGSRSGLVGLVGGLVLALGMLQTANKLRGLIAAGVALGLMTGIMVLNFDLDTLSATRVGTTAEQWLETTPSEEARWDHWQDAARAAVHQPLLGWGWGAYRYAYLPFQRSSDGSWFVNADNLWLEIFVELGLVGVVLVAAGFVIVVRGLRQLGQSVDPIDHGLAVAGWFGLGALASSQLFDFGLRIPANSVMAAILFSAVVARSYSLARPLPSAAPSGPFRFVRPLRTSVSDHSSRMRSPRWLTLATLSTTAGLLVLTSSALARQAIRDKAIRTARYVIGAPDTDLASIEAAALDLNHHLQRHSHDSAMWTTSAQLTWHLARIRTVMELQQELPPQVLSQQMRALSRSQIRQSWYRSPAEPTASTPNWIARIASPGSTTDSPDSTTDSPGAHAGASLWPAATRAREHTINALLVSPLSPEARLALVSYDFAGGAHDQSMTLLQQVAQLRARHTDTLLHVGDLASESSDWPSAASCWQRAVQLQPGLTNQVLRRVRQTTQLRPGDVIPDQHAALRLAAIAELKHPSPDKELLARAVDALLSSPHSLSPAEDFRLVARLQRELHRDDEALQTLARATAQHPRDAALRLDYVTSLLAAGNLEQAQREATVGHQFAPADKRFEKILDTVGRKLADAIE